MPERIGCEILNRWSAAINKTASKASKSNLAMGGRPLRKIGGVLRSKVSRAIKLLRRIRWNQ
jgi:hypothetical protein